MKRSLIALIAGLTIVSVGVGSSASDDENRPVAPSEELVNKLSATILKHCPDAKIEVTKHAFLAKHGTMRFTVHGRSMTGEVSRETHEEEGPNFKGFMLRVSLVDGKYFGQAGVPQTINGPYFQTFIDAPATADGNHHHSIGFSYGSRLDPKLKDAIFNALPKASSEVEEPTTAPPEEDVVQRLTETIRKNCPDAEIVVTKEAFVAKYATMQFTIHDRMKLGEDSPHVPGFSPKTHQKEGPNLQGFMLSVRLFREPGVPDQGGGGGFPVTLEDVYFDRFIDHFYTGDGDRSYRVEFSYGKFVNQKLKQAILEAAPKSKRQKTGP